MKFLLTIKDDRAYRLANGGKYLPKKERLYLQRAGNETGQKFFTYKGRLTDYSFACGYVEERECKEIPDTYAKLYMEHSHYHCIVMVEGKRRNWETFDTLTDARKYFDKIN